jgi:hypothetical protein
MIRAPDLLLPTAAERTNRVAAPNGKEDREMYYIDLPWYAMIIWLICVLAVLLPLLATVALVGAWVIRELRNSHSRATSHGVIGDLAAPYLGTTMADGGDRMDVKQDGTQK